jgi:hypothetical protein
LTKSRLKTAFCSTGRAVVCDEDVGCFDAGDDAADGDAV